MCVLPADMLVPLGDGEWHVHRALGATEWRVSRHTRSC